jgi:hypothetical protein
MRILSLDQAQSTGYCISIDNEIQYIGVIKARGKDYHHKIGLLEVEIEKLITEHPIEVVTLESPGNANGNRQVASKLAGLFYCVVDLALRSNLSYHAYGPSTWRAVLEFQQGRGIKRAELKQMAIAYVNENTQYNLTKKEDDVAEAICMNIAFRKQQEK